MGVPEPPPLGAPQVGQGGRGSIPPPSGPSWEARAVGPRRPHQLIPPPPGRPWSGVRTPKGVGKGTQGNEGMGGGSKRANVALECVVKPRDAKLKIFTQSTLLSSLWSFAVENMRSQVISALAMVPPWVEPGLGARQCSCVREMWKLLNKGAPEQFQATV